MSGMIIGILIFHGMIHYHWRIFLGDNLWCHQAWREIRKIPLAYRFTDGKSNEMGDENDQFDSRRVPHFLGHSLKTIIPGLVNVYSLRTGKSLFLMGKSTISMAMFNSYVSLPEGN